MHEAHSLRLDSAHTLDVCTFALAGVAALSGDGDADDAPELAFLRTHLDSVATGGPWWRTLAEYLQRPAPADVPLLALAAEMRLNAVELLTVALAAAVEIDPMVGRAIAHVQVPLGGSRPTLGLIGTAFAELSDTGASSLESVLTGAAMQSGLLTLLNEGPPVAERPVAVALPLCLALRGRDSAWPGAVVGMGSVPPAELPPSIRAQAEREASALQAGGTRALVIRSNSVSEGRSVIYAIAEACGARPLFIENPVSAAGLAPWLLLRRLLPVFCLEIAPGERKSVPALSFYKGPLLALCGPDGGVDFGGEPAGTWTIAVPPSAERRTLWSTAVGNPVVADSFARQRRHGCGRIAHLGRMARHRASLAGRDEIELGDVLAASWIGEGSGLDTLAQPVPDVVTDEALVTTPILRQELERLFLRCVTRDGLVDGLGISAATRYRAGVRALFTGPSGTGKTLAAGWLATRLQLPLYRVDLSSVTSKYIGETEKNLAQLLARAEHAEVVLLFDEADSLFGRRTEIREANDRFANAQTNYLLQRIETFDGITILTANSRVRFDAAFARRLDAVLEFPLPGPEQRRALWQSHLGEHHALTVTDLNQLAVAADVCGGHIRNAVLAAAVRARVEDRAIAYADVVDGLTGEYRKLGRQMPIELAR